MVSEVPQQSSSVYVESAHTPESVELAASAPPELAASAVQIPSGITASPAADKCKVHT